MDSLPKRLERLEEALAALPPEYDAMTLGELDGFIAGVILCPVPIEEDEWLSQIWREDAETTDAAASQTQKDALLPLVLEHFRLTTLELRVGEEGYGPVYYVEDGSDKVLWQSWAAGFGEAMQLRMESWEAPVESDQEDVVEAIIGLTSVVTLAYSETDEGMQALQEAGAEPSDVQSLETEAADLIPLWVETLFDWRMVYRPDPVQMPVRVVRIGRNDPCPCGSGKKYKKCCGAAEAA